MLKAGEQEFQINPLSVEAHARYTATIIELAQELDRPIQRFTAVLGDLSPADRASAIQGFLARADWQTPPENLVNYAATTHSGVAALAAVALEPRPTNGQFIELCADGPAALYWVIRRGLQPPTTEELIRRNAKLKDRIQKCLTASKTGSAKSEDSSPAVQADI